MTWTTDDWRGLYRASWKSEISAEAMKHPAKFARGLIMRVYAHAAETGWLHPGDHVIDPFGGVALGSLDAMQHGLHWHGCELEARFVAAGQENIAAWARRYAPALPGWGSATLHHGDSRRLLAVLGAGADGVISSPPYADGCRHTGGDMPGNATHLTGGHLYGVGIDGVIASPPYAEARIGQESGQSQCGRGDQYGATPGQLSSLPGGDFDAAVSSPPYADSVNQSAAANDAAARLARKASAGVDIALPVNIGGPNSVLRQEQVYGNQPEQVGAMSGETFWSAAREIVAQTYAALKPGGHAVWVVKGYVRNKALVDFPDQWRQLCEAAGFVTRHEHRAWLVDEEMITDLTGATTVQRTEYKSFFRRLNESRGSPRIDWETIWCQEKPT